MKKILYLVIMIVVAVGGYLWGYLDKGAGEMDTEGNVTVAGGQLPLSGFMSEKAKQLQIKTKTGGGQDAAVFASIKVNDSIERVREVLDEMTYDNVSRLESTYPVNIGPTIRVGGVPAIMIEPKEGVPPENQDKILINLHGGGFIGGWYGGRAESIPLAGKGKFRVLTVDYRMAPEYSFPAYNEDVEAVYRALLKDYKPENIAIYGCSAGGIITAQATAWIQQKGLPRPGAIGIFCGSGYFNPEFKPMGDSAYFTRMMTRPHPAMLVMMKYSKAFPGDAEDADPSFSPAGSLEVLAKFPPSLIIMAERESMLSSALYTHRRLIKAGAVAELHVWPGMWHGFIYDDVPEAVEAYDAMIRFFNKHLGSP